MTNYRRAVDTTVALFVRQDRSKCMRRGSSHATAAQRASKYVRGRRAHLYVAEAADSERGDIKSIGMETEKLRKNHHLGSSF